MNSFQLVQPEDVDKILGSVKLSRCIKAARWDGQVDIGGETSMVSQAA